MGRKNRRIPYQRKAYKMDDAAKFAEYEMLKRDVVAHLKEKTPENIDRALAQLRERLGV